MFLRVVTSCLWRPSSLACAASYFLWVTVGYSQWMLRHGLLFVGYSQWMLRRGLLFVGYSQWMLRRGILWVTVDYAVGYFRSELLSLYGWNFRFKDFSEHFWGPLKTLWPNSFHFRMFCENNKRFFLTVTKLVSKTGENKTRCEIGWSQNNFFVDNTFFCSMSVFVCCKY